MNAQLAGKQRKESSSAQDMPGRKDKRRRWRALMVLQIETDQNAGKTAPLLPPLLLPFLPQPIQFQL